ncbi:MAG: hypothetical protein DU430_08685 [Candidatus Tokpelaia sp.]|nr:MAG: hypothetical protein DU430_08685 [Candidatus Tokpelaia sp.]KAA6404537.1 hypothetical protein DPQ22_09480 [Candidatus Tokpelaia sp.]
MIIKIEPIAVQGAHRLCGNAGYAAAVHAMLLNDAALQSIAQCHDRGYCLRPGRVESGNLCCCF